MNNEGCPHCGNTDYNKRHPEHYCSKRCRKTKELNMAENAENTTR